MKGDASVWSVSRFWINARRAPSTRVAFAMKWETRPWYAHLPYEKKGDTHTRGVSCIMSPCSKISGPVLSLATLNNFLLPPSALTLDTVLPLPPTIDAAATCRPQSRSQSMPLPHPRPRSMPPPQPQPQSAPPPSSSWCLRHYHTAAFDLDPAFPQSAPQPSYSTRHPLVWSPKLLFFII
jgi:hypothetical protein